VFWTGLYSTVYAGKYLLALGEGGARISADVILGKKYGKVRSE
jgi:hypothetical protein